MGMLNTHLGSGPSTVKRFILSEGSGFTIPPNSSILYSEVVVNSDGDEILELWLAVPTSIVAPNGGPTLGPHTIYNKTTVYEEDDFDDDDDAEFDAEWGSSQASVNTNENLLRSQIESDISKNLSEDEDYYYD